MSSFPVSARAGAKAALRPPKALLRHVGDERLVEHIRRGDDVAFEIAFERYGGPMLGFCRHMLGSREEAEDALQHTFAAAYRQLIRDDRAVALKPWLYTIARHRCVSMLRARREQRELPEVSVDDLGERVERRAELRELLSDLAALPAEPRAALLLAELADLSHAEIATVLDCETQQVKALVYRARSSLIARRDARALPCEHIREQLATRRRGALRRTEIVHHLAACAPCRDYREQIKRQRKLLAAALPVAPSAALKAAVLGGGGGGAAGGLMLGGAGVGVGAASGAKVAAVVAVAVGGALGATGVAERIVSKPETTDVAIPARELHASERRGAPKDVPATVPPTHAGRGPRESALNDRRPTKRVPPGHDPSRVRPGRPDHESARVPPRRDPTRVPPGRDSTRVPPGRGDSARVAPGQARVPAGRDSARAHAQPRSAPTRGDNGGASDRAQSPAAQVRQSNGHARVAPPGSSTAPKTPHVAPPEPSSTAGNRSGAPAVAPDVAPSSG